eukprot:SAG11_NODE_15489_length_576_cov_1.209644_1_plen_120_part_00
MDELGPNLLAAGLATLVGLGGAYYLFERRQKKVAQAVAGLPLDPASVPRVTEVRVRCGALVDNVTFVFSDGTLSAVAICEDSVVVRLDAVQRAWEPLASAVTVGDCCDRWRSHRSRWRR